MGLSVCAVPTSLIVFSLKDCYWSVQCRQCVGCVSVSYGVSECVYVCVCVSVVSVCLCDCLYALACVLLLLLNWGLISLQFSGVPVTCVCVRACAAVSYTHLTLPTSSTV